jgi:transposase-like protein/DNA-directed RNA polymerase subunit RPC12/RpoP
MFQGINSIEFNRRFKKNEDCYFYLIEKKWGKGYQCSRCGCKEFYKGRTYYHRRCKACGYGESVTANTLFHGMKMPMLKAFHMIFRLTAKKKGMPTTELGAEVGVQQKTAWLFKRKLQVVMKQNDNDKLSGRVDADETLLGGYTKKHRGRSLEEKQAVLVTAEKLADGRTGNIRMGHIENFKADTLKFALKAMVENDAVIKTDMHRSYQKLRKEMSVRPVKSRMGKGLEELHKQIMQFKNWLRGTHHKCSAQHLHAYLDEYVYRFNKRNARKWIFNDAIQKFMNQIPHPYPVLKTIWAYNA